MKGVLLAGGRGTRLYPCTMVINKHLLPIYDKPMIFYPLETLRSSGCTDILVIIGGEYPEAFLRLLKNGKEFGFKSLTFAYQENSCGGIADALLLAEAFIGKDKFLMMLGDNLIINQNFSEEVKEFMNNANSNAQIFLKEVENPESFGVATLSENGDKILNIIEKPKNPESNKAIIGLYLYSSNVFGLIKNLKPSARGELEITDVNREYLRCNKLTFSFVKGDWLDTGSFDSLYLANKIIYNNICRPI